MTDMFDFTPIPVSEPQGIIAILVGFKDGDQPSDGFDAEVHAVAGDYPGGDSTASAQTGNPSLLTMVEYPSYLTGDSSPRPDLDLVDAYFAGMVDDPFL